jgi:VanZ family protein
MTRRALHRGAWGLTLAYWLFAFVTTHLPPGELPKVAVSDKLAHFVSYGLLCGALSVCLWLGNVPVARSAWVVLAIGAVYGVVDELLQIPVGRTASVGDWVADVAGAATAVMIFTVVRLATRQAPASSPSRVVEPASR